MADVVAVSRIIVCIDVLPAFFLAAGSAPLELRVKNTPWEALYELSWADLVQEVLDALLRAEVLVLGPGAAGSASLMQVIFGAVEPGLSKRHLPLRAVVSETGHAVLDQIASQDDVAPSVLADLYQSFATRPSVEEVTNRLGIDKVTQALLDQRFDEDLRALSAMARVQVLS